MASLLAGTFFLLLQTAVNEDFSFQGDTLAWAGLREGEALGVSEGRLPFSRSSPPGHAAVMRYGMCNFIGSVLYSAVLAVSG